MLKLTIQQLVRIGLHIGSSKRNSVPQNYFYGYGYREGVSIIDLEHSVYSLRRAARFVEMLSLRGGRILFIAVTPIRIIQRLCFFLSKRAYQLSYSWPRWEGGFLSNWRELVKKRLSIVKKLTAYSRGSVKRRFQRYAYFKESLCIRSQKLIGRSRRVLKRICRPRAVFLMNDKLQSDVVSEVSKIELPLVGLVNTHMSAASMYSFPIYGNTESMAVQRLVGYCMAYSALRGLVCKRRILYRRRLQFSLINRSTRSEKKIRIGSKAV